mmetsp:Transcript_109297/g.308407  ORF Transcript_109297/g.308407 Transcript_109297/m.308407 type:complete len:710 (-) Transcript_109297:110-2239(-)|eukprot:CAMPEP_0117546738 /NCGR_PEP_ID=MMETSP0784-20121206/46760_1 /TAXON_ID=39447 /ORGANISM="" /LENGTH=709 /DNA_ID=CAMNT_0005343615 /DNA_START=48 /DNA_END=2177 /DNA_ORIENTATION=-
MAATAYIAPANNFPEPPLKRLYPWSLDNRYGTDIIAGKVESDGAFKGLVLKDAQLHVLQQYLQVAHTHMPENLPTNLQDVAQALQDGYPTLVLTRGVYGRELDVSPGPIRNKAQAEIWELVRKARQEKPRMRITCIDVPAGASTAEVAKCLEPPLNAYQELAYYDGTWFTPDVKSAAKVLKLARENPRKPLHHKPAPSRAGNVDFNSKRFDWVKDELEDQLWSLYWKPVHTEEKYVPPPVDPSRLAVDAYDVKPNSVAEGNRNKLLGSAAVGPAAVHAVVDRESRRLMQEVPKNSAGSREGAAARLLEAAGRFISEQELLGRADPTNAALWAAERAAELLAEVGDSAQEALALLAVAKAHAAQGNVPAGVEATSQVQARYQALGDARGEAAAIMAMAEALLAASEPEEALKMVSDRFKLLDAAGDLEDQSAMVDVVVRCSLAAGRPEAAQDTAQRAEAFFKEKDYKKGEAAALGMVAGLHAASDELPAAIEAQRKAQAFHRAAGDLKSEAGALRAVAQTQIRRGERGEAAETAETLVALSKSAAQADVKAMVLLTTADVHLALLEGIENEDARRGAEAAADAAREALELCKRAGDVSGQAAAYAALGNASLAQGAHEDALSAAKEAEALCKDFDVDEKGVLSAALLCGARANLALGKMHSAMWDAKKALVQATAASESGSKAAALKIIEKVNKANSRPVVIGRQAPIAA